MYKFYPLWKELNSQQGKNANKQKSVISLWTVCILYHDIRFELKLAHTNHIVYGSTPVLVVANM